MCYSDLEKSISAQFLLHCHLIYMYFTNSYFCNMILMFFTEDFWSHDECKYILRCFSWFSFPPMPGRKCLSDENLIKFFVYVSKIYVMCKFMQQNWEIDTACIILWPHQQIGCDTVVITAEHIRESAGMSIITWWNISHYCLYLCLYEAKAASFSNRIYMQFLQRGGSLFSIDKSREQQRVTSYVSIMLFVPLKAVSRWVTESGSMSEVNWNPFPLTLNP